MTTFDEREKAHEKRFAMDEELRFKAMARRNRMLAEWAAAKLGMTGTAVDDYVKAVRKADLAHKGTDDVFAMVKADLAAKSANVADTELRQRMGEFLAKAVSDLEGGDGKK